MAISNSVQHPGDDHQQKPLVFISYSHSDKEWKDRFAKHLGVLESEGYLTQWYDRKIDAGDDWFARIDSAMNQASVAVLLVSENSLTSDFILRIEVTRLLQRRDQEGLRIFPVIIKPCDWEAVGWRSKMQLRPRGGRPISAGDDHEIGADFAEIAKEIRLLLGRAGQTTHATPLRPLAGPNVHTSKLPMTDQYLFGRDFELDMLDGAWLDPQTNVLSLVAWGGIGKTTLVKHWLGNLAPAYRGARRVFAWSFFSPGTQNTETSADEFIDMALRWFGDPDPTVGSPTDKGARLAGLVQQDRTLLILDGLEPTQSPPGPDHGKVKDVALAELLRQLDALNPGLCLITTRVPVRDLRDHRHSTAPVIELSELSDRAGAQLLHVLGVKGEQEELELASREFRGHSLALSLLGTYIRDVLDGDVRRRSEASLPAEDHEQGGQARRIMVSYEQWFDHGPELAILRALGLFDRPAGRDLLDVLRRTPAIQGLSDQLVDLPEPTWRRALARLRHSRLLADRPDPRASDTLDAHPMVREYFGESLREENPDAWRDGHSRLYEHLRDTTKPLPETLDEMLPLFRAMYHGCHAGDHQKALMEVYRPRMQRGDQFYINKKLGAPGADLAAISGFFEEPWSRVVDGLSTGARAYVLHEAGYSLRAVGRLPEAAQPMLKSLKISHERHDWPRAAQSASEIADVYLALGRVGPAVKMARECVSYADKSDRLDQRVISRCTLAAAMHQAGHSASALDEFGEAEALQLELPGAPPLLSSFEGFRYCDLLLDLGYFEDVRGRAAAALAWDPLDLLSPALDRISLGRAEFVAWKVDNSGNLDEAAYQLNEAVDALRKAGAMHELPRGLLTRAALRRVSKDLVGARSDIDEAMRFSERSQMKLCECDAHLEYARLFLAEHQPDNVRAHVAQAKALIDDTKYRRRREDVAEIEIRLGQSP